MNLRTTVIVSIYTQNHGSEHHCPGPKFLPEVILALVGNAASPHRGSGCWFQLVAQCMQYRKDTPILMQVSFQNMEILCQDPPLAVQAVC